MKPQRTNMLEGFAELEADVQARIEAAVEEARHRGRQEAAAAREGDGSHQGSYDTAEERVSGGTITQPVFALTPGHYDNVQYLDYLRTADVKMYQEAIKPLKTE